MKQWLGLFLAALVSANPLFAQTASRPNILLILTDDLGFSDLGCYGSEIATPTLDRLAAKGVRFTQFYNTAKCHSTRVSLLTGRWCIQAGDSKLNRATTAAEALGASGYFTAMAGKWHLSKQPTDFGFERYFGHLSGACNYYKGDKTFRLNGEPWTVPSEGFYTTVANVDYAIRFLDDAREAEKPWFLYLAFNAPHAPLQPLEEDYRRYLGKYDAGWDTVRAARVRKQAEIGLFGQNVEPSPRPDHIPAWDSLSPEMKSWESRRMAAYAAMIDRVDQEIGRLVADLEKHGELDNTLILFFSDNGACPYDRRSVGIDREPFERDTAWSDSTGWAWVRNSPFRYYKQNQYEGGVATPAIAHWPAGLKTAPGALVHTPAHIVDVLPTLAEVAGADIPTEWPGRELTPLAGVSLAPILAGERMPAHPPIHFLFSADRGLRDGDWKLVSFRSQPWELYNIAQDRTELHDLAAQQPEIAKRMIEQWHEMTANVLMADGKTNAPVAEAATGHTHPEWTIYASPEASSERKTAARQRQSAESAAPEAKAEGGALREIRARAGTKLQITGAQLVLQCSGDDPGLAIESLPEMPGAGPYTLEFRVKSKAKGEGEIFWTTDAKTKLPRGERLAFSIEHNGEWQDVSLEIPETKRLFALRLDPCAGEGEVRIEGLALKGPGGAPLMQWP